MNSKKSNDIGGVLNLFSASNSDKTIQVLNDEKEIAEVKHWVPSSSKALNIITGGGPNKGGLPVGRIIEIFGDESSGKSTISYDILANAQKKGYISVLIDSESSYTKRYGQALGMDNNKLIMMDDYTVEHIFDKIMSVTQKLREFTKVPIVFLWDSLEASETLDMKEKQQSDKNFRVGDKAKAMSEGLRKLANKMIKLNISLIVINQTRVKIGQMFGDPTTTGGGKALRFYAVIRIHVRSGKVIKNSNGKPIGKTFKIKVVKNKCYDPHGEMEGKFNFIKEKNKYGPDKIVGLVNVLEVEGHITRKKGSSWLTVTNTEIKFQEKTMIASAKKHKEIARLIGLKTS